MDTPSDTAALVDYTQIESLLDIAGRTGVDEILRAFWRSTDDLALRLKTQIDCGDFVEASRTSHAVKGSAANVGANALADAAKEIEHSCRELNAEGAVRALARLRFIYEQTKAAISERLEAAA